MIKSTPCGLDEIISTFGHFNDPTFEANNIVTFNLPYTLLFGESPVNHSRCHKLAVDNFIEAFTKIKEAKLEDEVRHFAGIYAVRSIRGFQAHPSTHSWGIAIDLEPNKYPLGSMKRFPDEVVKIWNDCCFFYGGDFKGRKDPMHFQLATHY